MEIISVVLLILSGQVVSYGYGRLFLYWTYDVIVMALLITTFGLGLLALVALPKMGLNGFIIALVASILLPFIFIKFNAGDSVRKNNDKSIIGYGFWLVLLIIFTIAAFNSYDISVFIDQLYSLGDRAVLYVMSIFVVTGVLVMLMFVYEYKLP